MIQSINISDVKQVYTEQELFVNYSGEHLTVITIVTKGGTLTINCYSKKEIKHGQ